MKFRDQKKHVRTHLELKALARRTRWENEEFLTVPTSSHQIFIAGEAMSHCLEVSHRRRVRAGRYLRSLTRMEILREESKRHLRGVHGDFTQKDLVAYCAT